MNIEQGGIYLCNLNPVKGHEQSGYRPVLVIQNNILNKNLNTVIVAPITKNLNAKGFLTTYFLEKTTSKLDFDSIVLIYQLRTIDKSRIEKYISTLPIEAMTNPKRQIGFVF